MGPDFLYIGCQKAGSGWLYDQLSAHASFWMPPIKELHYFDGYEGGAIRGIAAEQARAKAAAQAKVEKRRKKGLLRRLLRWKKGRVQQACPATMFMDQVRAGDGGKLDLDWYASLFRWKGDRLSGDITPAYSTLSAGMIGSVAARFPDLRCILFVRDPVERLWSHVCHALLRRQGILPKDWPELVSFLTTEPVAARSYPSRIFARWRDHIPAERIFIGFFDQLAVEPDVLRADVLHFLGAGSSLPAIEPGFDRKRGQLRVPCPPEMRRRLAEWFADELHACAATFGGPATLWPLRYGLTSAEV